MRGWRGWTPADFDGLLDDGWDGDPASPSRGPGVVAQVASSEAERLRQKAAVRLAVDGPPVADDATPSPWHARLAVVGAIAAALWYFAPQALIVVGMALACLAGFAAAWACVALGCTVLGGLLCWILTGRWLGGAGPG